MTFNIHNTQSKLNEKPLYMPWQKFHCQGFNVYIQMMALARLGGLDVEAAGGMVGGDSLCCTDTD